MNHLILNAEEDKEIDINSSRIKKSELERIMSEWKTAGIIR